MLFGVAASAYGSDVGVYYVVALAAKDVLDGFLKLFKFDAQIWGCSTEENHISTSRYLLGDIVGVEGHAVFNFAYFGHHLLNLWIVVDVDEWVAVGDYPTFVAEPWQVAEGLHWFAGEDDVGLAFGDNVGEDRLGADAEVAEYTAAAL